MPSVRKERWQSVVTLLARGIKNREWHRRTAVRGDAHQPTCVIPENDYAIAIPRSADGKSGDVAQGSRRPAGDVNFLEFSPGIKRDVPAIGRPEKRKGRRRQLRASQRPRLKRIARAYPQPQNAIRPSCGQGA